MPRWGFAELGLFGTTGPTRMGESLFAGLSLEESYVGHHGKPLSDWMPAALGPGPSSVGCVYYQHSFAASRGF